MARDTEPNVQVLSDEPWTLMYTSGTTGKPKGAIRSHNGNALMSLVAGVEFGISSRDIGIACNAHVPCQFSVLFRRPQLSGRGVFGLQQEEF